MNKAFIYISLFLIVSIFSCKPTYFSINANHTIEYTIKLEPGLEVNSFVIELSMTGDGDGRTDFNLPYEWGPAQNLDQYIKILQVQNAKIIEQDNKHLSITHGPLEPIKIKYRLSSISEYPIGSPNKAFDPNIQSSHFQIFGNSLFVYPNDLNKQERPVTITWENFPDNWVIHNSFATQKKKQSFRWRDSLWLEAIFVGGDYRIDTLYVENDPVYVAMRGKNWSFSDDEYLTLLKKVITQQRKFWNDYDFDYFTVTLAPYMENNTRGRSYQGTGLQNAFALNATENVPLADFEYLFSHELMHEWIGRQIKTADPEAFRFWFSEGFTDYFTFINMRDCGLIDQQGYVDAMNEVIVNYYTSPVSKATNDELAANFFSDYNNYGKLAYHRGCIFALYVDWKIRASSNGKHQLKTAMQDFLKACKNGKQQLSDQLFKNTINPYLKEPIDGSFEKYIQQGELVPIESWMMNSTADVVNNHIEIFDLGFDYDQSEVSKKIVGIKEGSTAYEAGLRNGQPLKGASIYFGFKDYPVDVYVEIDGEETQIQYKPVGLSESPIPQFVLK